MQKIKEVRTRFAPSPTGYLHIGGARTALFSWLYARHSQGKFVLRIEDTDQQRSTEESTRAILDAMDWLGLNWDEGPFFQAERVDIHRTMVRKLVEEDKAYYCTCTPEELEEKRKRALAEGRKPKYDGTCREKKLPPSADAVVRFRCPETGTTIVDDLIKGKITFNNEELDDLIRDLSKREDLIRMIEEEGDIDRPSRVIRKVAPRMGLFSLRMAKILLRHRQILK